MLARPTLTKPVQDDASKPKTQARPTEERFLLRVEGQIKRSFSSKEAAATVPLRGVVPRGSPPALWRPRLLSSLWISGFGDF